MYLLTGLIVLVTVRGITLQMDYLNPLHVVPGPEAWSFAHSEFMQATGVISFAYVCHHNTFLLRAQLKDGTVARFRKVTHISVFLALLACVFLAVIGYTTFYSHTVGNLLNNFTDLSTIPVLLSHN